MYFTVEEEGLKVPATTKGVPEPCNVMVRLDASKFSATSWLSSAESSAARIAREERRRIPDDFGYAGLPWEKYVVTDERLYRPAEVHLLLGNAAKARRVLGWSPRIAFSELVRVMTEADLRRIGALHP